MHVTKLNNSTSMH